MLARILLLCVFLLTACRRAPESKVVRLVDVFDGAKIEGSPSKKAAEPGMLWDFSKPPKPNADATLGWKAGDGVTDLKVVEGRLTGKSTTGFVHRVSGTEEFELFHHAGDPLDSRNVASQHPEQVARLKALLTSWNQMVESGKLPKGDAAEGLSSKELERLKSLGYVQ